MAQEYVAAKDRMNRGQWGVFSTTTRSFSFLGMGKRYCERKAAELNGGKAVVLTKMEKLRHAYQWLKAGLTLRYGSMAVCWIGTCERYGSPSYGKEYIYWQHYGSSAETVSLKNFKWLLDTIFEVKDYDDYTIED